MDFKYKISVIIPVYNCEEFLKPCIDSLLEQTMPREDFQIIFVNDGSSDNSGKICADAAEKYSNITYFEKENGGVSSARNKGIELAEGKYIMYLDADDTLSSETLLEIYNFFEEHYEETDLVTYKIVNYYNSKPQKLHYRYKILNESGVYNLNEGQNCYISQSTMNICVKNKKDGSNILFDTNLVFHEDQKYIFTTLKDKMTIGFCNGPEYRYLRHELAVTKTISKAYFIFENTMNMWEEFFDLYPQNEVPPYLQAFYLHDLTWKTTADDLLPYHYSSEEFKKATDRLINLIKRIDDEVILNRTSLDIYFKHTLLKLKENNSVELKCNDENIELIHKISKNENPVIYTAKKITAIVNTFKPIGNTLHIDAFLKSPVFMYCDMPELYLVIDGKREKLELTHSSHECYKAKIKTAVFWRFKANINIEKTKKFHFEVVINGKTYNLTYYYSNQVPLQRGKKYKAFIKKGVCYKEKDGIFTISSKRLNIGLFSKLFIIANNFLYYLKINPRILVNRALSYASKLTNRGRIWLYLDRYGVYDNAYDQFKHDIKIKDGVKRYYIINQCDLNTVSKKFTEEERLNLVVFGSRKHKMLYFAAEKIITSFSNLSNICPFGAGPFRWYTDLAQFELIYLQHGLLHASLKSMYAKERCIVDKVVVSSNFEVNNFIENYGYDECDLIKSGMPRYDFMQPGSIKKNRIVFSPSWRGNLIGPLVNNSRVELRKAFLASDFYKQTNELLNSEKLHKLLEENDLYLDFKNHPIFKCYNDLFEVRSDRICLDGFDTNMDEYRLMITDYSSIVFDSVYMNCPVVYFVPDYDKFKAGVSHGYRQLDLPLEEAFGPFTQTADELLQELEKSIKNNFIPQEPYKSRMDGFFLCSDNNCRQRIYEAIK